MGIRNQNKTVHIKKKSISPFKTQPCCVKHNGCCCSGNDFQINDAVIHEKTKSIGFIAGKPLNTASGTVILVRFGDGEASCYDFNLSHLIMEN